MWLLRKKLGCTVKGSKILSCCYRPTILFYFTLVCDEFFKNNCDELNSQSPFTFRTIRINKSNTALQKNRYSHFSFQIYKSYRKVNREFLRNALINPDGEKLPKRAVEIKRSH